jgi:hypothetical protein
VDCIIGGGRTASGGMQRLLMDIGRQRFRRAVVTRAVSGQW